MSSHGHWPQTHSNQESPSSHGHGSSRYDLTLPYAMPYSDEFDESADIIEVNSNERMVRRRSSKACDQCRKSKCKCERASPNEPCRNCSLLGTECTFLGPSRKRGPPKGYIDAIEARLHQLEALVGAMLASSDERAVTLLDDISQDPLAKDIIDRVDSSPYGVKGRGQESNNGNKGRYSQSKDNSPNKSELASTHPSNEWQDLVTALIEKSNVRPKHPSNIASQPNAGFKSSFNQGETRELPSVNSTQSGDASSSTSINHDDSEEDPSGRRQRRKIVDQRKVESAASSPTSSSAATPVTSPPEPTKSSSSSRSPLPPTTAFLSPNPSSESVPGISKPCSIVIQSSPKASTSKPTAAANSDGYESDEEEDLPDAIGQLSLNEDHQVRYHGKASGLYLLGEKDRIDQRNEGGIWRFPKARVWPPLPPNSSTPQRDEELDIRLPPTEVQEHLLNLYFTFVHPILPILNKRAFFESLDAFPPGTSPRIATSSSSSSTAPSSAAPFTARRRRRLPSLLLFAMYAVAARYSNSPDPNTAQSIQSISSDRPGDLSSPMWEAGDEYLVQAQRILDRSYSSSRPETCQALLLMGYREIGIGAMAQAWTYIGMAIRMAQDLGMHRCADGWARAKLGGRLFGEEELQERRRIWFACVVMDKYVSSYIGRPLMIFERDFDTLLPHEDDAEEFDDWIPYEAADRPKVPSVPGRIISCFNAVSVLSGIISMIVQAIYAVRPVCSRHGESVFLEGILTKWYIELPEHLRHEPSSSKKVPLPHVLTLHMQYWCAVLLLHRPFIRNNQNNTRNNDENEARALAEKNYELSVGAANHITSIATLYMEHYPLKFSPPFLCYYVFSASIMHVTSLSSFSQDLQARIGLNRCMEILKAMEVVWPSAGRAFELLKGSKVHVDVTRGLAQPRIKLADRRKRSLNLMTEDLTLPELGYPNQSHSPHQSYDTNSQPNVQGSYPSNGVNGHAPLPTLHAPHSTHTSHSTHPAHSTTPPNPYYRVEHRGVPEHHFDNIQYSGSLTTSVMPQTYSTGLVDDRGLGQGSTSRSSAHEHDDDASMDHRYPPQYWNDYSAYQQLGNSNHYTPAEQQPSHPNNSSHLFLSQFL